ncbi:MAG: hypothetical protein AAF628_13175 [Planctomycetota bacterium]
MGEGGVDRRPVDRPYLAALARAVVAGPQVLDRFERVRQVGRHQLLGHGPLERLAYRAHAAVDLAAAQLLGLDHPVARGGQALRRERRGVGGPEQLAQRLQGVLDPVQVVPLPPVVVPPLEVVLVTVAQLLDGEFDGVVRPVVRQLAAVHQPARAVTVEAPLRFGVVEPAEADLAAVELGVGVPLGVAS